MKKQAIAVKDKTQYEIIIDLLLKSGRFFSPHSSQKTAKEYAECYGKFPLLLIENDRRINAGSNRSSYDVLEWPKQAEKILSILFGDSYEVKNVGVYTAKVTNDGIEVGCQKISFEKLDEIVKMVDKFKKNNP